MPAYIGVPDSYQTCRIRYACHMLPCGLSIAEGNKVFFTNWQYLVSGFVTPVHPDTSSPLFPFLYLTQGCHTAMCMQGALGRFINHSCEPNCETQKWVVQGSEIAIGLFTTKAIPANTELTFDYNFERYGDKVAVCLHALLEHASAQSV